MLLRSLNKMMFITTVLVTIVHLSRSCLLIQCFSYPCTTKAYTFIIIPRSLTITKRIHYPQGTFTDASHPNPPAKLDSNPLAPHGPPKTPPAASDLPASKDPFDPGSALVPVRTAASALVLAG